MKYFGKKRGTSGSGATQNPSAAITGPVHFRVRCAGAGVSGHVVQGDQTRTGRPDTYREYRYIVQGDQIRCTGCSDACRVYRFVVQGV